MNSDEGGRIVDEHKKVQEGRIVPAGTKLSESKNRKILKCI